MPEKSTNLQKIREVADIAAQEIEQTWPGWKKDLSKPKEVTLQAADREDRDRTDWRY